MMIAKPMAVSGVIMGRMFKSSGKISPNAPSISMMPINLIPAAVNPLRRFDRRQPNGFTERRK